MVWLLMLKFKFRISETHLLLDFTSKNMDISVCQANNLAPLLNFHSKRVVF